ncbi:MAG: LPS export ABC transporter periplasmic protein LptC [Chitinispirillaceae bacterium]|nr:LPS export ABC transporter periplasmic protein LptC [Chitinispirillaceae bacterium]
MRAFFIVLIFAAAVCFAGCAKKKEVLPVTSGTISSPIQEFDSATLFFYEDKVKRWKLEAKYMRKPLSDTGQLLVLPVKLTLYDSMGTAHTRVLADSGTTTPALESFLVWGNVWIRNQDSLIVRTQKLWWVKGTHKVRSDTYVQIETVNGDILRGKGLEAVEDFSTFSFKSQVSGKFPNFKNRMETGSDDFF